MARIFITGSTDGLGRAAAQSLMDNGHEVIVHARTTERLTAVKDLLDRGAASVVGDLSDIEQIRDVADQVNRSGALDSVVHNAGVLSGAHVFQVNVLAPYLLTALVHRPRRLIYLSSGMHRGGHPRLEGLDWSGRRATASYSDSKLLVTALAAAVPRYRPGVFSNAVDPGWVPTRMGGRHAPDDLELGHRTQVWLAEGEDPATRVSGYWHHQRQQRPHPDADDQAFQDRVVEALAEHTGLRL